jgi:uncharacterized NAD-dependent epimerase/dehydratase family protein
MKIGSITNFVYIRDFNIIGCYIIHYSKAPVYAASFKKMNATSIHPPYLLFLGNVHDRIDAKTATGVCTWRPERCAGQLRLESCSVDLDLPDLTIPQAAASGVRTLVIGLALPGGELSQDWVNLIAEALSSGLDVASGLHSKISDIRTLREAARKSGSRIIEIRNVDRAFPVASYRKRTGKRLLTVGTDCSVGKMHTALALEREMKANGWLADFRATGQTGILIAGSGIPVDAVVSDFVAGAAETLSPDSH